MVHQRPRAKRTRCVVGDNRRRNIDSYDSSGSVRQWPRDNAILESILFKSLMKKIDDNILCNNFNYIGRGNQLS